MARSIHFYMSVLLLVFGLSSGANASLVFEVLRVSDSVAQIQGTGSVDVNAIFEYIEFESATTIGNMGLDGFSGDLTLGGASVVNVFTRTSSYDFSVNFWGSDIGLGDSVLGLLTATLDVETWDPVGTTGDVTGGDTTIIGSYSIVSSFSSVPEPTTIALMGLGLAGIGWKRRKAA